MGTPTFPVPQSFALLEKYPPVIILASLFVLNLTSDQPDGWPLIDPYSSYCKRLLLIELSDGFRLPPQLIDAPDPLFALLHATQLQAVHTHAAARRALACSALCSRCYVCGSLFRGARAGFRAPVGQAQYEYGCGSPGKRGRGEGEVWAITRIRSTSARLRWHWHEPPTLTRLRQRPMTSN